MKIFFLLLFAAGCAGDGEKRPGPADATGEKHGGMSGEMSLGENELPDNPALPDILRPEASGVLVKETDRAVIDYSNSDDGYVMVRLKTRRKQNNPANCFVAESPFQRIRAESEV